MDCHPELVEGLYEYLKTFRQAQSDSYSKSFTTMRMVRVDTNHGRIKKINICDR